MSTKLQIRPMSVEQFAVWRERRHTSNVAAMSALGLSVEQAAAVDQADLTKMLPEGLMTPGEHLRLLYNDEDVVGFAWLRLRKRSLGVECFLHDFQLADGLDPRVPPAAMSLVEHSAREAGATWLRLNASPGAQESYARRGYVPTRYRMSQSLVGAQLLEFADVPDVTLEPMDDAAFDAYVQRVRDEEAENRARAGITPPAEAAIAAGEQADLMKRCRQEEDQHFLLARSQHGDVVAWLWLEFERRADGTHSIGHDFSVEEELRGRGYGRAILAELRKFHLSHDVRSVSFIVYGYNTRAKALYESIGYTSTQVQLFKDLTQSN